MSENKKENSGNQGMKITNCGICYSKEFWHMYVVYISQKINFCK
jgi:hypothetical protein